MNMWALCAALLVLFSGISGRCDDAPQRAAPVAEQVSREAELGRLLETVRLRHERGEVIRTRSKWPRGLPLQVEIGPFSWMDQWVQGWIPMIEFADCHQEVLAIGTSMRPIRPTRPSAPRIGGDRTYTIPLTCIEDNGIVGILVRLSGPSRREARAFEPLTLSIRLVDSVDEILAPVVDPDMTARLAQVLKLDFVPHNPDQPQVNAVLGVRVPNELPHDLAVALRIELLVGDEVVATARWCATRPHYHQIRERVATEGVIRIPSAARARSAHVRYCAFSDDVA